MQLFISVFNTMKLKYVVIIEVLLYHDYKINKSDVRIFFI